MNTETQLDDLVSRWQDRRAQGEDVSAAELCKDCPDLRPEVERRLGALRHMQKLDETSDEYATIARTEPLSADVDAAATTVAGYEILGELDRGGQGVVYKARQTRLGRMVALKMILAGGHAGAAELARFRTEAGAIARLQHPNIVQIYEVGEQDGLPYFSLEFCAGGSLANKLGGVPLPANDAAALVEKLARAMHVAHEHGVLHRDLKPANVLLQYGGAAASGDETQANASAPSAPQLLSFVPKITDFGLAKMLDEAGNTMTGARMGTPPYMAPEQARGQTREIGPACDVYALGAILYECLTGRPPFRAATTHDTLMQVIHQEPVPPRQLNAEVPRDLETVCLKCLHKEPLKRYASAAALGDDLARYQRGDPVQARPVSRIERGVRWARRNPALAGWMLTAAVTLVLGTGLSSYFAMVASHDAQRARDGEAAAKLSEDKANTSAAQAKQSEENARHSAALAKRNEESARASEAQAKKSEEHAQRQEAAERKERARAEELLATSTMQLAKSRFEDNNPALAEDLLEQVPARFRLMPWQVLKSYTAGSLFTLRGHLGPVTSVTFDPDGKVLASASLDGTVKLWDARTGVALRTLRGHKGKVTSLAFAVDGHVLASAGEDKTVKLWDVRTGAVRTLRGHAEAVTSVAFAPDGQTLASGSEDKTVKLWDARTGTLRQTLPEHEWVASLAFAADGRVLAAARLDGKVSLWDTDTWAPRRALEAHSFYAENVAFSGDGQLLASASRAETSASGGEVKLWDARNWDEQLTLTLPGELCVAFAPDGQVLASAGWDNTVALWDARTGAVVRTLRGHTGPVTSVAFTPDGQLLASASSDNTIRLWSVRGGDELRSLRGHTNCVECVAFAADGRVLASASGDNTVWLWDAQTGAALRTLPGHTERVESVAFSADGRLLASASMDETIKVWDAQTWTQRHELRGHTGGVMSVSFAADGMLASAGQDNTIKLWDPGTGTERRTLSGHTGRVVSVAFAADGPVLASASADKTVKLWDARTGTVLHTLRGHADGVTSVAFAPGGQVLASGSEDKTIKLWDVQTGAELRTLHGHRQRVQSVGFAADDRLLPSASEDHTIRLWDARTGAELRTLHGHSNEVTSVAFAPGGEFLASASWDETVRLWNLHAAAEPRILRGHTSAVTTVAFAQDGRVLASASNDNTVRLWDLHAGVLRHTLPGDARRVELGFAADGKILCSRDIDGATFAWEVATGKRLADAPPKVAWTRSDCQWSPDGGVFAQGQDNGLIVLLPRQLPDSEDDFRMLVTSPDAHLHREKAENSTGRPWALAFHLGRYLAARHHEAGARRDAARGAAWLTQGPQRLGWLGTLPASVRTPFHEPSFPDASACTGVLYKDSGIAPVRLLIGTTRALAGDPQDWLNHAFHGGALYRNGDHAKALTALEYAAKLHGKPTPLTSNFLGLTYRALGNKSEANARFQEAQGAADASWDDGLLQYLMKDEIDAAAVKPVRKQKMRR